MLFSVVGGDPVRQATRHVCASSSSTSCRQQGSRAAVRRATYHKAQHASSTPQHQAAPASSHSTTPCASAAAAASPTATQELLMQVEEAACQTHAQQHHIDVEQLHLHQLQHRDRVRLQQQLEELHQQQQWQQRQQRHKQHLQHVEQQQQQWQQHEWQEGHAVQQQPHKQQPWHGTRSLADQSSALSQVPTSAGQQQHAQPADHALDTARLHTALIEANSVEAVGPTPHTEPAARRTSSYSGTAQSAVLPRSNSSSSSVAGAGVVGHTAGPHHAPAMRPGSRQAGHEQGPAPADTPPSRWSVGALGQASSHHSTELQQLQQQRPKPRHHQQARQQQPRQHKLERTADGVALVRLHKGSKPSQVAAALHSCLQQEQRVVLSAAGAQLALVALQCLEQAMVLQQQQQPGSVLLAVPQHRSSKRPGGKGRCQVYDLMCCLQHDVLEQPDAEAQPAAAHDSQAVRLPLSAVSSQQQQQHQQHQPLPAQQHLQEQEQEQKQQEQEALVHLTDVPMEHQQQPYHAWQHHSAGRDDAQQASHGRGALVDHDAAGGASDVPPSSIWQPLPRYQQQLAASLGRAQHTASVGAVSRARHDAAGHLPMPLQLTAVRHGHQQRDILQKQLPVCVAEEEEEEQLVLQEHHQQRHQASVYQHLNARAQQRGCAEPLGAAHSSAALKQQPAPPQLWPAQQQHDRQGRRLLLSQLQQHQEPHCTALHSISHKAPAAAAAAAAAAHVVAADDAAAEAAAVVLQGLPAVETSASLLPPHPVTVQVVKVSGCSLNFADMLEDALGGSCDQAGVVQLPVAHAKQAVRVLEAVSLVSSRWQHRKQQQQQPSLWSAEHGGSSTSCEAVKERLQLVIQAQRGTVHGECGGSTRGVHVFVYAAPLVQQQ